MYASHVRIVFIEDKCSRKKGKWLGYRRWLSSLAIHRSVSAENPHLLCTPFVMSKGVFCLHG